jgi:GntR family transcriptional regulator, rspAB operon transcriptional repressor
VTSVHVSADDAPLRGRPTARDHVAARLREQIVRGDLAPGARLNPGEVAERLGVSQTPAREAIQLLATEGLVRSDSFRGARVSELTMEEYEELSLMRIGLERLAARLAVEQLEEDALVAMRGTLDEMAEAAKLEDVDAFFQCDRRFHLLHCGASGRETLVRRIMALRASSERYARVVRIGARRNMKDTLETNRRLLDALRGRDGARSEAVLEEDLRRRLQAFKAHVAADAAGEA